MPLTVDQATYNRYGNWLHRLQNLADLLERTDDFDDIGRTGEAWYVAPQLYKIIYKMILLDQNNVDVDKPTKVNKLVKISTYIPRSVLVRCYGLDPVVLGGLYVEGEVWLIPDYYYRRSWNYYWGGLLNPRLSDGMPSNDEACYGTLRLIDVEKKIYGVLSRNGILDRHVWYSNQWSYPVLE